MPKQHTARADAAANAGFFAGLATFLIVLLPAAASAWNAASSFALDPTVADPGRADLGGGFLWTLATLLLVGLPVLVGATVDRVLARRHPGGVHVGRKRVTVAAR